MPGWLGRFVIGDEVANRVAKIGEKLKNRFVGVDIGGRGASCLGCEVGVPAMYSYKYIFMTFVADWLWGNGQ